MRDAMPSEDVTAKRRIVVIVRRLRTQDAIVRVSADADVAEVNSYVARLFARLGVDETSDIDWVWREELGRGA